MKSGERYIVVEGGEPSYVLMPFEDYATLSTSRTGNPGHGRPGARLGDWERANAELEEVRAIGTAARLAAGPATITPDPATISLEDLPL